MHATQLFTPIRSGPGNRIGINYGKRSGPIDGWSVLHTLGRFFCFPVVSTL